MSLLPFLSSNDCPVDGTLFQLPPFCKSRCNSAKCKKHYEKLKESDSGSYCCPYGLSSYVFVSKERHYIYTGLRIKGVYNKEKSKIADSNEYIYNPAICEHVCATIAQEDVATLLEKRKLEMKLEAIRDLLHETRSLNGQIKNSIDTLWDSYSDSDEVSIDNNKLIETLKNVHVSSFMISNRFSYFDSVINPALSIGGPYQAVIFKKFDKMRRLLRGYLHKNVKINVNSPIQSDYKYNIFPTFEILLFILLENAIKYSPNGKQVDVTFEELANVLDVTIKSVGPYCDDNEIFHLCEKGFRGENARISQSVGQGFGLNFAQKICQDHHVSLSFSSTYLNKDHGVKYGYFIASLHFDTELQPVQ